MTIATIISISGQAWARDETGNLRELRVGDILQEGETLVTSDSGRVELEFADGLDPTVIDGGQEVVMTPDLDAEEPVAAEDASAQDEDLEALLTAIDEGEGDLLEDLDATAAGAGGAGGEGGGHDFVRLARITENVNPLAFEYGLASLDGTPEFEEQAVEEQAVEEPAVEDEPDSLPTVATVDLDGDGDTVWESALPEGSGGGTLTTSGTLQIDTGTDLLALIEVQDAEGNWLAVGAEGSSIVGEYGTLTVNPDGSWSYTLAQSIDHPEQGETGEADQLADTFAVRVTDDDGDVSAPAALVISVTDDGPAAANDVVGEIPEDGSITIDVLANDTAGADGVDLITGIAVATGPTKGTVAYNGDGTFTYTANPGAEGADRFSYTITDTDGDASTATVSLSIAGDSTPSLIPVEGQVSEAGLPDGSSPETDYETTGGTFAIETGGDSVGSIVITSVVVEGVDVTAGGTVQGEYGTLEVTVDDESVHSWTYTLDDNTLEHETQGPASDEVRDAFTVVLTDSDGDSTTEALNIDIIDDVPVAVIDSGTVQSGGTLTVAAGAGLLVNDTLGADDATVTAVDVTDTQGALTWDADGSYTYTAIPNATYSDVFTYTITDGDGDTATATLTISVSDGSPTAPDFNVQVNEASLDLIQDGDDLAAGTVTGSDPTSTAETVSGTLAATDPNGDALTYTASTFTGTYGTLEIDASGIYTYTLTAPVTDTTGDDGTNTVDDAESFTYTVTDANGNSSHGTLTVDIIDDVPVAINPDKAYLVNVVGPLGTVSAIPLDLDGNIDDNYGADQGGMISFAGIAEDGTATALNAGGSLIYLYTDGPTLVGSTLSNSSYSDVISEDNQSYKVFTVELNPDRDLAASSDSYSFTLHQQIDGGASSFSVADGGYLPSGGNSPYYFFEDATDADRDILLTPTEVGSTVNSSNNDFATGTGLTIGGGEGIRIDFVNGLSGDAKQGPISYEDHYTVQGVGAIIGVKSDTSMVRMTAYDDYDDGTNAEPDDISIGNGVIDPITAVLIQYGGKTDTVYSGTESVTVGERTFTLVWDHPDYTGQVLVEGVVDGTSLAAVTNDGFSSLEIHYEAGTPFTVNSFNGVAVTPGEAVDFALDLSLTDSDGDTVLIEDAISLQLSPDDHESLKGTGGDDNLQADTDQASTLVGLAGDDALMGDSGEDILVGGVGDDILTGGAGADTFVWNLGDKATADDPAEDTVTDFSIAEGDVLNLTDLLSEMPAGAQDAYVLSEADGTDTILHISTSGGLAVGDDGNISGADQTILLNGVDMGTIPPSDFIQSLIDDGQLDID